MSISSIDAILGSSSVVNGSDGLTGALDFRLAEAGRGIDKAVSPWATLRVDHANGTQTATGIDGKVDSWRYSLEGSYYKFHDRIGGKQTPHNVFSTDKSSYDDSIPNTAYDQWAAAGRFAYDGLTDRTFEISYGYTNQDDARRPDGYQENSNNSSRISRFYDPETFSYLHLRDKWSPDGLFFDELTTTLWWHQQNERQIRERLASSGTVYRRQEYDDRVDSMGIEPQFISYFDNHELTYGLLFLTEETTNDYEEYRNLSGTSADGATAYQADQWGQNTTITDGAEYDTFAVYVQDLWQIDDKWSLLSGLRYTHVDWDFDVASKSANDVTGGLRASYKINNDMVAFAGIAKAFRAPNLQDLDGATDRGSSGTTSFGNPNLDPEVSFTYEAGWRYRRDNDQFAASVFYTSIDDIIQRTYPAGSSSGVVDNGESAYLYGYELEWNYGLPVSEYLDNRLAFFGTISKVESEQEVPQSNGTILDEPMSRTNRIYGKSGLHYTIDQNWWARGQVRFHGAYDDIESDDESDVRLTVPGNSRGQNPGYGVIDLSVGAVSDDGNRWGTLTLENLANKTYRQLGSGADAPGFNIGLNIGVRF